MVRIREPGLEGPDASGILRKGGLSNVVDGQALSKNAKGTAAAGAAERINLRSELAYEVSHLHVDKREKVLRGRIINESEELEASRVEMWHGCNFPTDVDFGDNFFFCIVADGAEVVPAKDVLKMLQWQDLKVNEQALSSHFGGYKEVTGAQNGHRRGNGQSFEVVHVDGSDVVTVLFQCNAVPVESLT
jgi:hypothetical protein